MLRTGLQAWVCVAVRQRKVVGNRFPSDSNRELSPGITADDEVHPVVALASGHTEHVWDSTSRLPASARGPILRAPATQPEAGTSAPTLVGSTHG